MRSLFSYVVCIEDLVLTVYFCVLVKICSEDALLVCVVSGQVCNVHNNAISNCDIKSMTTLFVVGVHMAASIS